MTDLPTWLDWVQFWSSASGWAPRNLTQPILPGWTVNIDSQNSSSPQTESDIVAHHSYGRQLGRVEDALAWLIEQHGGGRGVPEIAAFTRMKDEIDAEKTASTRRRLEQVLGELGRLERDDPDEHARLCARLREAIGP